jgi:hypothetical protein
MANFKMHVTGAVVGGAVFSSFCLGTQLAQAQDMAVLVALTTIGGILPDIDLDHSSPTKLLFSSLAVLAAFAIFLSKADSYSLLELWLAAGLAYALVKYPVWETFNRFTQHRGVFHTLIAAFMFWFLTTTLCYEFFDFSRELSWVSGMAVFVGYIVHLVLDEVYSVDFMNKRLKNSFGTALKIINTKDIRSSLLMGGAMVLVFLMTPDSGAFASQIWDSGIWGNFWRNLWPEGTWFSF